MNNQLPLEFYTIRINKTGKLRYAIADTAQHACAVNGTWVGVCTILNVEKLPRDISAIALRLLTQVNTGTAYRGEHKPS